MPVRFVESRPDPQPALEDVIGEHNPATQLPWSHQTLELWGSLAGLPSTQGLVRAQWTILARAMILDDLVVAGDVKHLPEVRLQLAKFFVTPDDMMRGRIIAAQADEADAKRPAAPTPATDRFSKLKAAG